MLSDNIVLKRAVIDDNYSNLIR